VLPGVKVAQPTKFETIRFPRANLPVSDERACLAALAPEEAQEAKETTTIGRTQPL